MFALPRQDRTPAPLPFRSGEEAWFWTMECVVARRDGGGPAWRPSGPARPCDPDDVIKCLDSLYQRGMIVLLHVRTLRNWGERQTAPRADLFCQAIEFRRWQQAMAQLEWALRGRGIVR